MISQVPRPSYYVVITRLHDFLKRLNPDKDSLDGVMTRIT